MSFTSQHLRCMFEENDRFTFRELDRSEPGTPIFKPNLEQNELHKKTVEDLSIQNQQLMQQVAYLTAHLNAQLSVNENMNKSVQRLQKQLQREVDKNQLLTQDYIKKHEECFDYKRKLMKQRFQQKSGIINKISQRMATCPSECSTVSSPGNCKNPFKQLTSSRSLIEYIGNF